MMNLAGSVLDDDDFLSDFCEGCGAVVSELGYDWCPAEFDPKEPGCERRGVWLGIHELLRDTEKEIEARIG
jgi:hypothetical protein